jgi:outer membrane receptor for ferrienterochelin and colicins
MQANLLLEGFYTKLKDVFTLEKIGETENGIILKERRNATGARVAGITAEARLGIPSLFDVQLGYTYQRSRYVEPEQWSDDVKAQHTMFRSPDHYGYLSSNFYISDRFNASLFGTFTGRMLVQHAAHTLPNGEEIGDADVWTKSFLDMGFKCSYTLNLSELVKMEVNAGIKNLFDVY